MRADCLGPRSSGQPTTTAPALIGHVTSHQRHVFFSLPTSFNDERRSKSIPSGRVETAVGGLRSGKQLRTDVLLFAIGRAANSDDLGLQEVGIEPRKRGYLEVNENFQTSQPHIYAVGDVVGYPSLASAAYVQGRFAAGVIVGDRAEVELSEIPTGIYTSPEISSLGRTERELTDRSIPYEVGQSHFHSLARAQITGQTVGMLKLLFHRETLEILGIHCFGANASAIFTSARRLWLRRARATASPGS